MRLLRAHWLKSLFMLSLFVLVIPYSFAAGSPVGAWRTIDDATGQAKAIVQIWQTGNGTLMGKVVKVFPRPGVNPNEVCTACSGARKNKPIVGMVILYGFKQNPSDPNQWVNGEVLDPKTGKIYTGYIKVLNGGQRLYLRGYVGLPVFGRSQTWVRASR